MVSKALIFALATLLLFGVSAFGQTQTFTSASGTGTAGASASSSSTGGTQATTVPAGGAAVNPTPPSPPQFPAVSLPSETRTLQSFNQVALCAPLNVLIAPNTTTPSYTFTISAEQTVLPNINATVDPNGVLAITASGNFSTNQTIQLTVGMPADALNSVIHNGPGAAVYVAPGFNLKILNLTTGFGAGQLYADNVTVQTLNVEHHGIGTLVARGQILSATALSDAAAPLYLSGVLNSVQINLASVADAFIDQASTSSITGTAAGLNRVFYTAGTCQVTSPFSINPAFSVQTCTQQAFLSVPQPQPAWTCGIQVEGNFTCRNKTVLSLGPQGSSVSQQGAPTMTSTSPGAFYSQGATQGGAQVQAGTAQPGSATAASGIIGTGSVSSSASSFSGPGGSTSSTQTSQNGVTQGFTTNSGGQTTQSNQSGVLVSYGAASGAPGAQPETASANSIPCAAPLDQVRIKVPA